MLDFTDMIHLVASALEILPMVLELLFEKTRSQEGGLEGKGKKEKEVLAKARDQVYSQAQAKA